MSSRQIGDLIISCFGPLLWSAAALLLASCATPGDRPMTEQNISPQAAEPANDDQPIDAEPDDSSIAPLYESSCAGCHGAQLLGGRGPTLTGQSFWTRWEGRSPVELMEVILETMPPEAPGSLSGEEARRLAQFILKANGVSLPASAFERGPEGERRLTRSNLQ